MHSKPTVTVLLAVYNGAQWLAETIESVLTQTFEDFEFIAVDDGSIDNTALILDYYASRDKRITILRKANSGLSDSLSYGMALAKGEWIARIDADDICEPDRLSKQLALATADRETVFVGSGMTVISASGERLRTYLYPTSNTQLVKNLVSGGPFVPHSSAFFSVRAARAAGGYRSRLAYAQDHDLWLRLYAHGALIASPEPLIRYRIHTDQMTAVQGGHRQAQDAIVARVSHRLRQLGVRDPLGGSEPEFLAFRHFVGDHLDSMRLLDLHSHLANVKSAFREGPVHAARVALKNLDLTHRLIMQRIFPRRSTNRIAMAWLHESEADRVLADVQDSR